MAINYIGVFARTLEALQCELRDGARHRIAADQIILLSPNIADALHAENLVATIQSPEAVADEQVWSPPRDRSEGARLRMFRQAGNRPFKCDSLALFVASAEKIKAELPPQPTIYMGSRTPVAETKPSPFGGAPEVTVS